MVADPKLKTELGTDSEVAGYTLFNSLIYRLNGLLQSNAEGRQSAPPGSPSDGDHYIVQSSPTGDWSTFAEHDIAIYFDGQTSSGWIAISPTEGFLSFVKDEDSFFYFDGTEWKDLGQVMPTADVEFNGKKLKLSTDGNTTIESAGGNDIAFTCGGDNSYSMTDTQGFRIIDRTTATPTQMQIDQTSTAAYVSTAGYTTFTGEILAESGSTPAMPDLPSGYTNTNPGYIKAFNGTAEIAIPFVSLA